LEATFQTWDISGVNPVLLKIQVLKTSNETIWALYDYPATQKAVGRPSPVAVSSDLEVLRIGSHIFFEDENGDYQAIAGIDSQETYIDELASCVSHIAVTSRRNMTYDDLYQPENKVPNHQVDDHGEALARQMHLVETASKVELATASTDSKTAVGGSIESDNESDTASSQTSVSGDNDADSDYLKSLPLKLENLSNLSTSSIRKSESALAKQIEEDEKFFETDTESEGNSAEEDWSEESSDSEDDQLEDEAEWNDWGNERLTFEELEADTAERSSEEADSDTDRNSEAPGYDDADLENADNDSQTLDEDELSLKDDYEFGPGDEIDSNDAHSVESNYSLSNYSNSDSDADGSDVEQARHLEALIFGKSNKSEAARKTKIQVYDLTYDDRKFGPPVFHFTRFITGGIFNSPPAFHPSKPLLVWPLGDSEILFADYRQNTYFTRFLCCSRYKSCHVFIKTHFSASGDYVHFAALEAGERDTKIGGGLVVDLQISTHRLSVQKTTRSLPKLISRKTISLGHRDSLHVSNLPYTFHWAEKELFVTTRGQELDVIRIPLFKDPDKEKEHVCYTQSKIFLPRTAEERPVYFSPPSSSVTVSVTPSKLETSKSAPQTSPNPAHVFSTTQHSLSKKPKVKVDKSTHATVIIGSHSSIPSQGLIVPRYQVSPPIGVFLHEQQDLGGWTCKPVSKEENASRKRAEGGRLQGRFERFDKSEDCDIVPFLY
jgi:hypothetical protein